VTGSPHEHLAGASSISCVCRECGKRFFRRGNDVAASLSFSSPGGTPVIDPRRSRTWRDWAMAMLTHCDGHLPPMPVAVSRDLARERRRRNDENIRLSRVSRSEESHVEGEGTRTLDEWKELARGMGR